MSQPYKICPICETPNHRSAALCRTCGSSLEGVQVVIPENVKEQPATGYAYQFGETDLLEGGLTWKGGTYILTGVLALALILCAGILVIALLPVVNQMIPAPTSTSSGLIAPASPASNDSIFATVTPFPTMFLATVTPAPPTRTPLPTATPTETPAPCMQQVLPGDNLIAIVYRCGHRSLDVIDQVLEINNLADAARIQEGQVLEIPWPTPTFDPNALPTESPTEGAGSAGISIAGGSADTVNASTQPRGLGPRPTETLPPGVAWHQVQKDENIIIIAYNYGANVKILSDLNPEITFSQCDFGLDAGGPNCIVQLYEGQIVRVPAPTPTPTLSPTPSGSETPTPTATPTFNAPSPLSPDNRVFFGKGEFVTLRWVASGTLGVAQSYAVRVEDLTAGHVYSANTQELFFILPQDWQGTDDQRHEYSWTVSVIDDDNRENPYFTTQPRTFVWEGRGA